MQQLSEVQSGIPPTSFVSPIPMTLADLHANFAPAAGNRFMYARVTDLYSEAGSPGGVVINETGAHWQPLRPNKIASLAGDQNRTLLPLRTPPQIVLTGAITSLRTLTMGTQYAYPGLQFLIRRNSTGLLGVVLNGLGISLGVNGWSIIEYDGTSWQTLASSGLL